MPSAPRALASRDSSMASRVGDRLVVLSGDDATTFPLMAVGARGVISVVSNVMPAEFAAMWDAVVANDWKRARELHYRLFPMARAAFIETNPIPIKEAMAIAGLLEPEFRPPMCRMSDANRERLRAVLKQYGLAK